MFSLLRKKKNQPEICLTELMFTSRRHIPERNRQTAAWRFVGFCCLVTIAIIQGVAEPELSVKNSSSIEQLTRAAEQGDRAAQVRLADTYAELSDHGKAVVWYRKAADLGEPRAQWQLGRYFEFGAGPVATDRVKAVSWYERAAWQGLANAQLDLGQLIEKGLGSVPDPVEAAKWFILAASQSPIAKVHQTRLALKLSPGQILEAETRAAAFTPVLEVKPAGVTPLTCSTDLPDICAEVAFSIIPPTPVVDSNSFRKAEPRQAVSLEPGPDPSLVAKLQLKGIAAFGQRRVATINNRSVLAGEEANLMIDGQSLRLRCVEIRQSSAFVDICGRNGVVELKLNR